MGYLLQLKNVIYKLIHSTLWLQINKKLQRFSNSLPSMCVVNKGNTASLFYGPYPCGIWLKTYQLRCILPTIIIWTGLNRYGLTSNDGKTWIIILMTCLYPNLPIVPIFCTFVCNVSWGKVNNYYQQLLSLSERDGSFTHECYEGERIDIPFSFSLLTWYKFHWRP